MLETAPTRGEGFNTNTQTIDAQAWESDWDHLFNLSYTSVLSDRATNVLRAGRIGEQLGTGAQAFFDEKVRQIGFAGRDPFSIGQQNIHPSYITGKGGTGQNTRIRTYTIEGRFQLLRARALGRRAYVQGGRRLQPQPGAGPVNSKLRDIPVQDRCALRPRRARDVSISVDITVGPPVEDGFATSSKDRRYYLFFEDKWRIANTLTLNLGLRYDNQKQIPGRKDDIAPRLGFCVAVTRSGSTVVRGGFGRFYAYMPVSVVLNQVQDGVLTRFPTITITDLNSPVLRPDVIADSQGNMGVAVLSAAGRAELVRQRDALLAGSTFNRDPRVDSPDRQMPYQNAWSIGISRQLFNNAALSVDYVGNVSRDQNGVVDINEPVNGVRPGIAVFDPNGALIPAGARATNFRRVLQTQSRDEFNGDYHSLQIAFQKRMSSRWSGRVAYTLQRSHFVGLGSPDNRRVWLDNDIRADYGRFASDRPQLLAMSSTWNVWRNLNIAAVLSAISGAAINETVGVDRNNDTHNNNDRPIRGVDDLVIPIRSKVDSQGRAVINGLDGPGSFLIDTSFRYQFPLEGFGDSLDLFYDIFNVINRKNLVAPTGNRSSSFFMVPQAAQFARQMQFGIRFRF